MDRAVAIFVAFQILLVASLHVQDTGFVSTRE